jgi:hypothetical protein
MEQASCERDTTRAVAELRAIRARDELLAAAYLIPLIGVTPITYADVERRFGATTADLVRSVARARKTYAIGAGRLAFEGVDAQTLALALDLAALRGAHEMTPETRVARLDEIAGRAARLARAHLYLQYEVWRELAWWRRRATGSVASRI